MVRDPRTIKITLYLLHYFQKIFLLIMTNNIKCPNCGNVFDVEDVLSADIEKKYQQEFQEKLNASLIKVELEKNALEDERIKFEETKKKENEIFAKKVT